MMPIQIALLDEVKDWLVVFSTLDLQSEYWQLPADKDKTTFCLGPGMGFFQFRLKPCKPMVSLHLICIHDCYAHTTGT